jgi:hypothetical protein
MRRIEWEKMPKPLKLLLLPVLPFLGMLGWIMIVVSEAKHQRKSEQSNSFLSLGCKMDKSTVDVLVAELEHIKKLLGRIEKTIKESRTIFSVSEEDVWMIAEKEGIEIPEDKKAHVLHYVENYMRGYCYDSSYSIWDAIKDAIEDALAEQP